MRRVLKHFQKTDTYDTDVTFFAPQFSKVRKQQSVKFYHTILKVHLSDFVKCFNLLIFSQFTVLCVLCVFYILCCILTLSVLIVVTNYLIQAAVCARLEHSLSSSLHLHIVCIIIMCFSSKLNTYMHTILPEQVNEQGLTSRYQCSLAGPKDDNSLQVQNTFICLLLTINQQISGWLVHNCFKKAL